MPPGRARRSAVMSDCAFRIWIVCIVTALLVVTAAFGVIDRFALDRRVDAPEYCRDRGGVKDMDVHQGWGWVTCKSGRALIVR